MLNIGSGEMVLILVAALLLLGPQRMPELARGLGKFLREFRRQTDEIRGTVEREFYRMDQELQEPGSPAQGVPGAPELPAAGSILPPAAAAQPGVPVLAVPEGAVSREPRPAVPPPQAGATPAVSASVTPAGAAVPGSKPNGG